MSARSRRGEMEMKIELVEFNNGKWGVRRSTMFGLMKDYLDLRADKTFWWEKGSRFFPDCMASEDRARAVFENNGWKLTEKVAK